MLDYVDYNIEANHHQGNGNVITKQKINDVETVKPPQHLFPRLPSPSHRF